MAGPPYFVYLLFWIPSFTFATFCDENSIPINCTKIPRISCCKIDVACYTKMGNTPDFPGRPEKFVAKVMEGDPNHPQLAMTWSADGGAALKVLRGFHVNVNNKCYIIRFNDTFGMGDLTDASQNYFNVTSPADYGTNNVEVTSLPIPNIEYKYNRTQVSRKVNVTRRIEISREINKNATQKCEMKVNMAHNYEGICHHVYLMQCRSAACRRPRFKKVPNVPAMQTVHFTVTDVPAVYFVKAKPTECATAAKTSGLDVVTEYFQVRGSTSSCYIFDPDATTTEDNSASSPLTSENPESQSSGDPGTRSVEESSGEPGTRSVEESSGELGTRSVEEEKDNLPKYLIPVVLSLVAPVGAAIITFACALKKIKKLKSTRDDPSTAMQQNNLSAHTHVLNIENQDCTNIITEEPKKTNKAIIKEVHFTPGNVIIIWIPLAGADQHTNYAVIVYDGQSDNCICCREEDHRNTEVRNTCFQVEENIQKIEAELMTFFDEKEYSDFSGVIYVQRPVEIQEKSVLLIYSYDCEGHEETVTQFARILNSSKCNVKFERWDTDPQVDRRRWYENHIMEAHKVIIIHSEGTYNKYNAYVKKQRVTDSHQTSLGDTFSLALNLVLSMMEEEPNFRDKLRHVRFSYTSPEHLSSALITRAATYCITENFKELLLSIHDLPPSSQTSDYVLPGIDHAAMERLQKAVDNKSNSSGLPKQTYDSGIDSQSDTSGSNASTDNNVTETFDPKNSKRPYLNIRSHSADIYDGMMTPEVPTSLSPGVFPGQSCPFPPVQWHAPDLLDSPEDYPNQSYPPFSPCQLHPPELLDTDSDSDVEMQAAE